jgi:DNA-binding XRE family transcriptional regulator
LKIQVLGVQMIIQITREQREIFVKTRIEKNLSKAEVAKSAGISWRTLHKLEKGYQDCFLDNKLMKLCKVYGLNFKAVFQEQLINKYNSISDNNEILPNQKETCGTKPGKKNVPHQFFAVVISALLVIILLLIISIFFAIFQHRKDYINPFDKSKLPIEGPAGVGTARCQEVINIIDYNPIVLPNDRIRIQIVFSYYYEEGTPMVYISAYTEWEPDTEIRVFDGMLKKRGQITGEFITKAPRKPGIYRIRFFWALAYGPIISFYGHPSEDQLSTPMNVPYNEIKIEVMSRNIFDKILAQLPFIF